MENEITQTTEPTTTPATAPDVTTPASTDGNATGLDLNALNQSLSSLGSYSIKSADDVVKIIASTQKGMREAQEKAAKHEQRLRRVEPLLTEAEQNPEFQRYLYEKANEYASTGNNLDPSVAQVLNPVFTEIESIKLSLAERQMQDQLDSLAKDPDVGHLVSADVQQELLIEARATGNYNLTDHFWRKYGRSALQTARSTGKQEAVKSIQETNNAYPQGAAPSAAGVVAQAMDFGKMSQNDIDAYIQNEATKILSDTRYRDKVLGK